MKRSYNLSSRPAAVSLFNQKKRNRIPLTSTPSKDDFFSHTEFTPSTSSPGPPLGASGGYGADSTSASSFDAYPSHRWNKQDIAPSTWSQQNVGHGPAPGVKSYSPLPHLNKSGSTTSATGPAGNPETRKDAGSLFTAGRKQYQIPSSGFSQLSRHPSCGPAKPTQFRSPPGPARLAGAPAARAPMLCHFSNSFGPQDPTFVGKRSAFQQQTPRETQMQQKAVPRKAAFDSSVRILTAVVEGVRYWSQFKDKVFCIFELFATLDSAVTLGQHGSKNFLLRDGKHVVQCVFYENEQELPRLIRGQVYRCVGNYDRSKGDFVCASVRAAEPSEVAVAHGAVRASDAHMRKLVSMF
ncbi:spermatogenesis-associated protein 22 isoform X2 [Syngnathoides biaculeatus]|uniref:spermatogenesis-associated protein 22 isoform X2 n=1 Tax=Syngnathoides biaculeatus TaxID=300417 RepID=UPI002ADD5CC6|nr:spermatogenesis-associated protein 22 isoform X2 [Syngnathoides biaculeatus]